MGRRPRPAGRAGLAHPGRASRPTEGLARFQAIEDATDAAAARPWRTLGPERTERLRELLEPIARAAHTVIPEGNPIGLPALRS